MSSHSKNEIAYDEWSKTYDTGLNSTVAVDDLSFPPCWSQVKNKRVLEIGCGTGRHTQRLLAQKNTVVGVDLSQGMLKVAAKRLQGQAVDLVHGDILSMDLNELMKKEPFEAAVSALVLEHIADLDLFFARLSGVLKVGASVFISEIHPDRAKAGRMAHFQKQDSEEEVWLESHPHSESDIVLAAQKSGFQLLEVLDGLGSEDLLKRKSTWGKYLGMPMTKMFVLKLIGGGK